MTRQETTKVLAMMTEVYPSFLNGRNIDNTVNIWQQLFQDESYSEVSTALMGYIANDTKGFPPVPGQIKQQIHAAHETADGMTETSAWALVSKAVRNSAYNYREEFAKLPPEIQSVIGNPDILHDWALSDESEFETVIASNFQRSYRARKAVIDNAMNLPASFRANLPGFDSTGRLESKTVELPKLNAPTQENYTEPPQLFTQVMAVLKGMC